MLGGPARRLSRWALAVKQDLRTCTRLDLIAAYFAPNPAMLRRIEDKRFADHMRGYFEGELARSERITREAHRQTGTIERIRWSIAYFVVAVVDYGVSRRLNFGIEAAPDQ